LTLSNGNTFVIDARNNSKENVFVDGISLNGKKYQRNFITHKDIQKGGLLKFEMSKEANKKRGTKKSSYPYSMTK
jgi:putative alpha-1,2-mannosidase